MFLNTILRDDHALNSMLSRCGVLEPGPVNYVKLLERFQDRSDQGKSLLLDRVRKHDLHRAR